MWFWKRLRRAEHFPTVLHITHPKAGSQWVYALLSYIQPDRIVKPKVAAAHVLLDPIRAGHIYPTVYLDRRQLERVSIPEPSRRFVIIRDLRDTLVSLYFSLRFSHPLLTERHVRIRDRLRALSQNEGLRWTFDHTLRRAELIQRSWIRSGELLLRYEEMLQDELAAFRRIVAHCELPVGDDLLRNAVTGCSFRHLSGRERGVEDVQSHYRKGSVGDWRNYFDDELKAKFKRRYADLLIETGYEIDDRW